MHVGVNLTSEEFSKLHNALCHMSSLATSIRDGQHEKWADELEKEIAVIREDILKAAYDADGKMFDKLHDHYRKVGEEFNAETTWSMYEVEDLREEHAYPGVGKLLHKNHWGKNPVVVDIEGNTWLSLFKAADKAIRESGDLHHCFIEGFGFDPEEGLLVLHTGS